MPGSGRPGRLPGPWLPGRRSLAGRCHRRDSAWPWSPWMPLPGHSWPSAGGGRTPVGCPWTYQRASWAPWRALLWLPSVVVLPCWEPPCLPTGQACRTAIAVGDHGQPTTRPARALARSMSFPLHLLRSGGRVEPGPGGGEQLHVGVGKEPVTAKPAAEQAGRHDGHALGIAGHRHGRGHRGRTPGRGVVPSRRPTASASQRTVSRVRSRG